MDTVTVVIPTYNTGRFVAEAIESALGQSLPAREVIVVNDGSTDDTDDIVATYEDRITYLKQANGGVSRARNTGLARASSDWVMFLDADDRLDPQALELLVGTAPARRPDHVVHGDVIDIDQDGRRPRPRRSTGFGETQAEIVSHLFHNGSIPPSAFAVPRRLAEQAGGFDPRFSYAADIHFWLRCACLAPFVHIPRPVLFYRCHDTNMSRGLLTSMKDLIEAKLEFQSWCKQNQHDLLSESVSDAQMLDRLLTEHYYRRHWEMVEALLIIARERGINTPVVRRVGRLRRLPKWVFAARDLLPV